jgi:hypothetical protein
MMVFSAQSTAATTATTTTTQKTAMTKPINSFATSAAMMMSTAPAATFLTTGVRLRVGSILEAIVKMVARRPPGAEPVSDCRTTLFIRSLRPGGGTVRTTA